MKKDIEWLKQEVWKQDIAMDKGYIYTDDLMNIINEVDEPGVLSQEWIGKNVVHVRGLGDIIEAEVIENLLVPKQKSPVIPQWVADNIESKKRVGTRLNVAMSEFPEFKLEKELGIDEYECNEIYARAWLDGYEVEKEKEKLYCVIIPTKDPSGGYYYLDGFGGIDSAYDLKEVEHHTESFIRLISENLWQFAKEVAE